MLILVGVSACMSSKTTTAQSDGHPSQETILNDIWVLEVLEGKEITAEDYMREPPRLEFRKAEGKVGGTTGCNSLGGSYIAENGKLSFGPLASTRMACPGDGEQRFLTALSKVNAFKIEDRKLYLMEGNEVRLLFKKAD